ncbi:HD domain-containing protein [Phytohabitans sp. LJ34]|uniref:HD domain-containing protein n=1 Tax=Phytohabitans sp. LJ34 TaxID=3452217 RepID=UPI003F8CC6F0
MDIEEGPIWAVLREKARDRAPLVKDLAEEAAGKLRLVRDTFPTYTLHDELHSANVLRIMGDLLGERVTDLSGLEAAMLILAAYYHDIGMVYTPEELGQTKEQPEFEAYLAGRPEEYLAVRHNDGEPPLSVLENYCRFRHADRVYAHLNHIQKERLKWGAVSLRDALGMLCRSHNGPAADLKGDGFDPHFLGACDLRLCAILLRLADILDFDGSRTPRSIYEHLGLAARADHRTATSDAEWRKHLATDGFTFPASREAGYPLHFVAGPESPAVEHDIRRFLDVVDDEVRRSRAVLDTCHPRWRGLILPGEVDRRNIISDGYKYGEFRFELDRSAVLELFTGERLYEDPYVFVRELLQNAIDAVRLRAVLYPEDHPRGVAVSCWEDRDGFVWVRVDDDGVGMDEDRLRDYFLRVGRSYYRTAELRADLLRRGRGEHDFVAISRFGIGVLSCFLAGDRVELSTRRLLPDGTLAKPLRLSLDRREEYFVLREPHMPATPLPVRGGGEVGYQEEAGTRIAVRIDPTNVDITTSELATRVGGYIHCPPIAVTYNGEPVGAESAARTDRPWLPEPVSSPRLRAEATTSSPFLGDLELGALPLDLTAASPTPRLRGQLVAVGARVVAAPGTVQYTDLLTGWPEEERQVFPDRLRDALAEAVAGYHVSIDRTSERRWQVVVRREVRDIDVLRAVADFSAREGLAARLIAAIRGAVPHLPLFLGLSSRGEIALDSEPLRHLEVAGFGKPRWSHNGIALPEPDEFVRGWIDSGAVIPVGVVALADGLRPDVTMSRQRTSGLSVAIHSAMWLSVRRAARPYLGGAFDWLARATMGTRFLEFRPVEPVVLAGVLEDPLLSGGDWEGEAVIEMDGGRRSLADVRAGGTASLATFKGWDSSDWPRPRRYGGHGFERLVGASVIQLGLDMTWRPAGPDSQARYSVRSNRRPELARGLARFPPLFFVPYEAPVELLRHRLGPVNRDNPLAAWLIERADALAAGLPVLFRHLGEALTRPPSGSNDAPSFNALLDRVAIARPDLRPPSNAYLWEEKSKWEWWTR